MKWMKGALLETLTISLYISKVNLQFHTSQSCVIFWYEHKGAFWTHDDSRYEMFLAKRRQWLYDRWSSSSIILLTIDCTLLLIASGSLVAVNCGPNINNTKKWHTLNIKI